MKVDRLFLLLIALLFLSGRFVNAGPVGDFFCDDHTHLSSSGALEIAGLVAKALRDQNIPLAAYLK